MTTQLGFSLSLLSFVISLSHHSITPLFFSFKKMKLFSTSAGYCKGYDQKSKNEKDKCRVNKAETEKQRSTEEEDESQPLINLGLGIGGSNIITTRVVNVNVNDREKDNNNFDRMTNMKVEEMHQDEHDGDRVVENGGCRECSVVRFTEEQVEQLKRQLLIFNYMVWGLPVPLQLLLPIWRSFSPSCLPPSHLYLYTNTTSSPLLLAFFRGGFNHQQTMDPEPGRCRRTDGKKWRCHQSVIPNEKYCQKHMHRGSKRSRKLVEASPNPRPHNLITVNRNNNPSSDIKPKFQEKPDRVEPNRVMSRASGLTNTGAMSKNNKQNESNCGIIENQRIAVINQASGLDFSPKSVLQNDVGIKYPRVETCKNSPELSESRCKRTDGKKWQCKKEVVPDRKYCAQHINRGRNRSQKPFLGLSASGSKAQTAAHGSSSSTRFSQPKQAKSGLVLDTNLKISLPTSPADLRNVMKDDSMARNSSSSEATESDTSTNISDMVAFLPEYSLKGIMCLH